MLSGRTIEEEGGIAEAGKQRRSNKVRMTKPGEEVLLAGVQMEVSGELLQNKKKNHNNNK